MKFVCLTRSPGQGGNEIFLYFFNRPLVCFGARSRVRTLINFAQIQPQLFVGTYPQNSLDIDRLKSGMRVTAVLSLQSDMDITALGIDWPKLSQAYIDNEIVCQRWPMIDFDREDVANKLEGAVNLLDKLINVGHCVYVHCTAGLNRAPSVVITHLSWNQNMDLDQAFELVSRARYCEPYLDAIRSATENRTSRD